MVLKKSQKKLRSKMVSINHFKPTGYHQRSLWVPVIQCCCSTKTNKKNKTELFEPFGMLKPVLMHGTDNLYRLLPALWTDVSCFLRREEVTSPGRTDRDGFPAGTGCAVQTLQSIAPRSPPIHAQLCSGSGLIPSRNKPAFNSCTRIQIAR